MDKTLSFRDVLSQQLEEKVIPFWHKYSLDEEHGGYYNNIDDNGEVYDATKQMWMQSREVWMWCTLYFDAKKKGQDGKAASYLKAAKAGAEFIRCHGTFGENKERVYFAVTKEGKPLKVQRKPWAECFYVLACILYGRATGNEEYETEGMRMFDCFVRYCKEPALLGLVGLEGQTPYLELGMAMFRLSMIDELRSGGKDEAGIDKALYEEEARDAISQLHLHVRDEKELIFERVLPDGSLDLDTQHGRQLTPGHAIEGGWFVLQFARKYYEPASANYTELCEIGTKMIKWSLKNGWDEEKGGIYYFTDSEGRTPAPLEWNMKLWWVHCETMVACLYAYIVTKDEDFLSQFNRVTDYSLRTFAQTPKGGWHGYASRNGEITHKTIGAAYKGFFHVPRSLLVCVSLLDEIAAESPAGQRTAKRACLRAAPGPSAGSVVYEVNLTIDRDIEEAFLGWLRPHMAEMLQLPGFVSAELAKVEETPPKEGSVKWTAQYRLVDRKALEDYFQIHAATMRGDGVKKFAGKFSAVRRNLLLQ